MSFYSRFTVSTIFRCYRTICDQICGFRSFFKSGNVLTGPGSSLLVQGCKHRLGVNLRGILCLSRLLYRRTCKSRASAYLHSDDRLYHLQTFERLQLRNQSLKSLAALAFSESGVSKRPLRNISGAPKGSSNDDDDNYNEQQPLRLMDYQEIIWPRPWKSMRNYLFSFLISSYFDDKFSLSSFLTGAEQVIYQLDNVTKE